MRTTSYSSRTVSSARLSLSSRLNAGTSSISAPARSRVAGITKRFLRLVGSTAVERRRVVHEHVVDRALDVAGVDAEAGRGVALGVEVDDEHPEARLGQGRAEVHRGRGLPDAALLVGDGDDPGQLEQARLGAVAAPAPPRRAGSARLPPGSVAGVAAAGSGSGSAAGVGSRLRLAARARARARWRRAGCRGAGSAGSGSGALGSGAGVAAPAVGRPARARGAGGSVGHGRSRAAWAVTGSTGRGVDRRRCDARIRVGLAARAVLAGGGASARLPRPAPAPEEAAARTLDRCNSSAIDHPREQSARVPILDHRRRPGQGCST